MTDESMDITPDTHFLESIRADRGSWWALMAEGVDNSLDAGANDVALTLRRDIVGLKDDGVGITRDRQAAIVKLGEHRSMPTTMLGAFGIGLKYHAVSAGDVLEVESASVDGRMMLRADWQAVIRSGRWSIPPPSWVSVLRTEGKTGTHIKIRALRWQAPTTKDEKATIDKLAQIFYPALAAGKRIALNGMALPLLAEPMMRDVVEGDVRLPSGKGAHVRGGITIDQRPTLYQVQVSYKHRVIMPQSVFGCGAYTGLRRLFARVDLTGPWTLGRFKNHISDNEADELNDAVLEILRPVLEKCHSAQLSMHVKEMSDVLNDMLPPELQPAHPQRTKDGSVSSGKRGKAEQHRPTRDGKDGGPARKHGPRTGIVIGFDDCVDEHGYGRFEIGKPNRIVLAKDNPHIAALLDLRDKHVGAQSLYAIASMIFHHECPLAKLQGELNFDGPFGMRAWQMTKRQNLDTSEPSVA